MLLNFRPFVTKSFYVYLRALTPVRSGMQGEDVSQEEIQYK